MFPWYFSFISISHLCVTFNGYGQWNAFHSNVYFSSHFWVSMYVPLQQSVTWLELYGSYVIGRYFGFNTWRSRPYLNDLGHIYYTLLLLTAMSTFLWCMNSFGGYNWIKIPFCISIVETCFVTIITMIVGKKYIQSIYSLVILFIPILDLLTGICITVHTQHLFMHQYIPTSKYLHIYFHIISVVHFCHP